MDKLLCKIGLHSWEYFDYQSFNGFLKSFSQHIKRKCKKCGVIQRSSFTEPMGLPNIWEVSNG